MAEDKCRVRVSGDFTVPVHVLKKGKWKETKKKFSAGSRLRGRFVDIHGQKMFRTGKFLLSPLHFDRIKYSGDGGMSLEDFDELMKSMSGSPQHDLHDRHDLLP